MFSNQLKLIAILLTTLTTSGCVSTFFKEEPVKVEIKTVEVQIPIQHPTPPRAIDLKEPYFYVVSGKNLEEFLERIEKESNGVFVAMSIGDYELMAYNMQELKRYINDLKEVVVYYRTMTDKPQEEQPDGKNN